MTSGIITLSKNKLKFIQSLKQKKHRDAEQLFIAEGDKIVHELLASDYKIELIVALPAWLKNNSSLTTHQPCELFVCSETDLQRISNLSTPNDVLALVHIPQIKPDYNLIKKQLVIGLDDVRDPGNLGTIIRMADWFGISHIVCSPQTVDVYNSKVIQSTMGAFLRVSVLYQPLEDFIATMKSADFPIMGTFLEGESIYQSSLPSTGLIILGNESTGISEEIKKQVTQKLFIPSYPPDRVGSESLNVAIATAIICSEFRRRQL